MTPLLRLQSLDSQLDALLPPLPGVEHSLDQALSTLFPNPAITARTLYFGRLRLLDLVGFHLFDGGAFKPPTGTQARHDDRPLNLPATSTPTSNASARRFAKACMRAWPAIGWRVTKMD